MSSQPNLPTPLDLEAIRTRLAESKGPQFWRSLEEAAGAPEFQAYLDNEFTPGTSEAAWTDGVSRRRLLELLGASLGLAGLTSCTKQPPEKIVPYVTAPEDIIAGKPLFYATSVPGAGGVANGVLVESHMGRPTKIEGNPEHPGSLGSTDAQTQAVILGLWDPDRTQNVVREGRPSSWQRAQEALKVLREQMLSNKGAGFRLLTENITSPSLIGAIRELLAQFPEAKWIQYEPATSDNAMAGARLAFGEAVIPVFHLEQAAVVVALDSDFLTSGPGSVRYAREFANRRRDGNAQMSRLYVVEPVPTLTGATADHRVAASTSEVENFARALAAELGTGTAASVTKATNVLKALVKDLGENKGTSLVIAGEHCSPAVHALAHAMNATLGNIGKTVHYIDSLSPVSAAGQTATLKELVGEMQAGKVEALLMVGGNPNYNTPSDFKFEEALRKVKVRVRLADFDDETAAVCHWVIPAAHALESWGDARAYDGSVSLSQPLIAPLYEGRQLIELLGILLDKGGLEVRDAVKEFWRGQLAASTPNFDDAWQKSIHDGIIAGSASAGKTVGIRKELAAELGAAKASGPELLFRPCPNVGDGRWTNNAWLQELPRPLTKVTWDNVVLMSPATAQKHAVSNGEMMKLGNTITGPAWIMPGQADDVLLVHLGYGRTRMGKIGNGVGFNAYKLRTSTNPWVANSISVNRTGDSQMMAVTQEHHSLEGRDLLRRTTLADFTKNPGFAQARDKGHELLSLYPAFEYKSYAWAMAIDLSACTGCNACTIACQAENNIPVVGKEEVNTGREMHWIRVDRYFEGNLDSPSILHQPVTCMHCENAPCESVCPVAATSHSEEGLNQMTYNRCVGTRYCSNNCPYKVRRFNFFLYSDWDTQSLKGLRNPNVTVRSRGVMEKCSYCVQRINSARIEAEKENRKIRDGEVITACQAACPSQAIIFGDKNDPESKISKARKNVRNYSLLADLGTVPRTTYLAKISNPNHELAPQGAAEPAHGAHGEAKG